MLCFIHHVSIKSVSNVSTGCFLLLVQHTGLPFKPDFAVTHITQLNSREGEEVLRAGPTPWGTVLQLPDSWVEAVRNAELPEDQPLNTPLEVRLA